MVPVNRHQLLYQRRVDLALRFRKRKIENLAPDSRRKKTGTPRSKIGLSGSLLPPCADSRKAAEDEVAL